MKHRVVSIAIGAVLLAPATGMADCAWVLWSVSRPQVTWELKGAYDSLPKCSGEREAAIGLALYSEKAVDKNEAVRSIQRVGDIIYFSPRLGTPWRIEYLCLPDTVDPTKTR